MPTKPQDLHAWLQDEIFALHKALHLRINDATDFVTAYALGRISENQVNFRRALYHARWGDSPVPGVPIHEGMTDEEILAELDSQVGSNHIAQLESFYSHPVTRLLKSVRDLGAQGLESLFQSQGADDTVSRTPIIEVAKDVNPAQEITSRGLEGFADLSKRDSKTAEKKRDDKYDVSSYMDPGDIHRPGNPDDKYAIRREEDGTDAEEPKDSD